MNNDTHDKKQPHHNLTRRRAVRERAEALLRRTRLRKVLHRMRNHHSGNKQIRDTWAKAQRFQIQANKRVGLWRLRLNALLARATKHLVRKIMRKWLIMTKRRGRRVLKTSR